MQLNTYFLGANTPSGFYSLFSQLYNPENENIIYLIKGGPGTGKSSIMKKIAKTAETKSFFVERIPCSSDPQSLDAIIIPELNISFADATSPHIINPIYPGVCEHIIELSQCWKKDKLKSNTSIIKKITNDNSSAHKKCIRYMQAASVVNTEMNELLKEIYDIDKIKRFTNRFINTEIKKMPTGESKNIFLSAVTPSGIVVQHDSLSAFDNIITIKDKYGYISNIITKELNNYCEQNKISRINCLCSMNPENKIDHILFNNKLAVFTTNTYHSINKSNKTIHAERFIYKEKYNKIKNEINFLKKTKLELISESIKSLEEAKKLHDILESYYMAAMDYNKVSEITEKIINEVFY